MNKPKAFAKKRLGTPPEPAQIEGNILKPEQQETGDNVLLSFRVPPDVRREFEFAKLKGYHPTLSELFIEVWRDYLDRNPHLKS